MGPLVEGDEDPELKEYEVILAISAQDALLGIASRGDAVKVARRLQMLRYAPWMGAVYDPVYESNMPDHEVRVTFAGHFGIYYTIDEKRDQVQVEYLEDCRRDPRKKFSQ